MSLHGDIRVNHHKIGEWQAQCQPGKDGIHPYRWGATLNGVTVRGVLTHNRADGALVLASKVTAAAATALAEATRAAESPAGVEPTLETGVAQRGHGGPENGTPTVRRSSDAGTPNASALANPGATPTAGNDDGAITLVRLILAAAEKALAEKDVGRE